MTPKELYEFAKSQPVAMELLQPAKGKTFVCIGEGCSSGTGENGTGMTVTRDGTAVHCWHCNKFFNNVGIIAATKLGLPPEGAYTGKDFLDVAAAIASYFGLVLEDKPRKPRKFTGSKKKPKLATPNNAPIPATGDESTTPPVNEEPDKEQVAPPDIPRARANLQKIVDAGGGLLTFRGLTIELMAQLGWGFLPDYHYRNTPRYSLFPAVIIPNDAGGVFARVVTQELTSMPQKCDKITPSSPTTLYLPASGDFVLAVFEGAINAASALQAVRAVNKGDEPALGFVSTDGTSGRDNFVKWLLERYPDTAARPKIAVCYDNDDAGQRASKELREILTQHDFISGNMILGGGERGDLNDVLQNEGTSVLNEQFIAAIAAQEGEFARSKADIELNHVIAAWEPEFGKIEQSSLAKVKASAEYLREIDVNDITVDVASSQRTIKAIANCKFYDFVAQAGSEFLARVAKARTRAQATMKQASAENIDVADSVVALASLDLASLNRRIDSHISTLDRAHKDYQKEYARQLERKRAAELESKLEKIRQANNAQLQRDTTGVVFPEGCPLNLSIPFGVEYCKDTGELKYDGEFFTATPTIVSKVIEGDEEIYLELAYYVDGNWRRRVVKKAIVVDHRTIVALASYGISITSLTAKPFVHYLELIQNFDGNKTRIPKQRLYDKPGWTADGGFVFPGDGTLVVGSTVDYDAAFSTKGDKKAWLAMYRRIANSSAAARVILGAALAAPLLKVLGVPNLWFHLCADSGAGKSAVNKFAASIYGNPSKMIMSFNATRNALEAAAMSFNDLPVFTEELQTCRKNQRENIDDAVYTFETAISRGRCQKDGSLRKIRTFRNVRISTGEQQLTSEQSGAGAAFRLFDVVAKDVLPAELASETHAFIREHYGLIGRTWISAIQQKSAAIRERFLELEPLIRREHPAAADRHITAFAAATVARVCFEAAQFGETFGDYRADADEVFANLLTKDSGMNASRALGVVAEFIASHPYNFRALNIEGETERPDAAEPRVAEFFGFRLRGGDIAIFPKALREILKEFPDSRAIIRGFAQGGVLDEGASSKRPHQKVVRVDGKPTWVYLFRAARLFPDDDLDAIDYKLDDTTLGDDDVLGREIKDFDCPF